MPNTADYENENDWMGACVPKMTGEGKPQDVAVAACVNMWKNRNKSFNIKAESLNDQLESIYVAFNTQFPANVNATMPIEQMSGGYVDEVFPDYVIVCSGQDYFKVSYTQDANGITFAPMSEWVKVEEVTTYVEAKIGARNSKKDQARLQMMHDYSVENGAICKNGKALELEEILVLDGATVKALGNGKVGGLLVRHSTEVDPDLTSDFFDAKTSIYYAEKLPVLYQHGFDETIGKRIIGTASAKRDDAGVWLEAQLNLRDEYEKALYRMAEKGKLGWSSGAISHLVEREPSGNGKAYHIKSWFIGEASLTPTPAEPRNMAVSLKSWITPEAVIADKDEQTNQIHIGDSNMEKEELKAMFDEQKTAITDLVKTEAESAAKKAVEDVLDKLPEVKAKMNAEVQVVVDEADRPFKSLGDQLVAVKNATKDGTIAPRMRALKAMETKAALGSNEAVPSQGEFLLEPTITQTLLQNIHEQGVFTKNVQRLPVGPNSNSGWIPGVDETSRATGSRWGGVRGYHAAEAASMSSSQPKFRKVNWELHKTYVLQYVTDELLNDVGQLTAITQKSSMEEIDFMANYDVLLGVGGDRPAGVLQSGALVSISRAATSAISHADIVNMWARMLPRNKANAVWYIASDVHPQLDQLTFTAGTTGILSPYINYDSNGVMRIYGRPVVETEFNPALGTLGDIFLADMGEYLYWEKNAIEAASSIHVQFLTDQTAFRYIYRNDGQTALASAITPANGSSSTQSPFVALLATT